MTAPHLSSLCQDGFPRLLALTLAAVLAAGCSAKVDEEFACRPGQDSPYADGIPYLGIHADRGNSDVIACETASAFEPDWQALDGYGLTQPNTFSPDGETTYATTSNPEADGCRLHAVDVRTGEVLWCRSYAPSIALGAVEVDAAANLYFTAADQLISLDPQGRDRWTTPFADVLGDGDAPWGLHFTPDGHIATVTSSGTVYLVARADGLVLDSLSIAETWGFVAPASLSNELDVGSLLPASVLQDIESVWGPTTGETAATGLGALLGAGAFCDNTVGIDSQGRIYVIGGGADPEHGALVQVLVGGSPEAPELRAGWHTPTLGGSATSPSISPGDRYVVIADGSSTAAILNPDGADPRVKVMDIVACDANSDADPDPTVCAVAYQEPNQRAPMVGAPGILADGTVYLWEFALGFESDPQQRDLAAFGPDGLIWEATLPDDLDWSSVITVTDNHLLGTATRITHSEEQFLTLSFPKTTEDFVLVLDRLTGELVWQASIPDDGTATVTVGPDGSIYVGVMGFLSIFATEERPDLGLVRFTPKQG
jgi:outer membrane protein assembly factor BamB